MIINLIKFVIRVVVALIATLLIYCIIVLNEKYNKILNTNIWDYITYSVVFIFLILGIAGIFTIPDIVCSLIK